MDNKVSLAVIGGAAQIDECKLISTVIINKSRSGIHIQGSAAYDKHLGLGYAFDGFAYYPIVKRLLVKHDIRPYNAAAYASWNALAVVHLVGGVRSAAGRAVASQYAAVQLKHFLAAGCLMKPVYILRDDRFELSLPLKLGKL